MVFAGTVKANVLSIYDFRTKLEIKVFSFGTALCWQVALACIHSFLNPAAKWHPTNRR